MTYLMINRDQIYGSISLFGQNHQLWNAVVKNSLKLKINKLIDRP